MSEIDELRTLIREVIRDQLRSQETEPVETVNVSTDEDLAAFVTRLLDLDPAEQDALRSGRKRFRLATPPSGPLAPSAPAPNVSAPAPNVSAPAPNVSIAQSTRSSELARAGMGSAGVRRVERGAVTEAMVRDAARAGERLVLGRAAMLTPLARDRARASGVEIEKEH